MEHRLPPSQLVERTPWDHFPDVLLHAPVEAVKGHVNYQPAKSGSPEDAARLVAETWSRSVVDLISRLCADRDPILVSVHAIEEFGTNAIPEALASGIAQLTGFELDESIVQTNVVNHTGASGFDRLARQALFDGVVAHGRQYLIVDDFVGQGGTIANLRGYIEARGGHVVLATALTGKPFSARLTPDLAALQLLRRTHGGQLEDWWRSEFGFDFECLTASEARYLQRSPNADQIRDRIVASKQAALLSSSQSDSQG